MATSEIPLSVAASSPTPTPLSHIPPTPAVVPLEHMDLTALTATDDFKRCPICGLPCTPTSFVVGPEEPFGWHLFAGTSTARCLACRSFLPCSQCTKIVDLSGEVPSICLWCRKLSEVYRASSAEATTASSLRVPEVASARKLPPTQPSSQTQRRKRPAEEEPSESPQPLQGTAKETRKFQAASDPESLQERFRFNEASAEHARERLTASALNTSVAGETEGHMELDLDSSNQSISDDGSQSVQSSQALVPAKGWSALGRVRQLFGIEPPKPEKPKKTIAARTRSSVARTTNVPSGTSRKRRKRETETESEESGPTLEASPVVKIEQESDADLMDSEASDVAPNPGRENTRSKLTHQGSQDTIRGTTGKARASMYRPAAASTASTENLRQKKVKREHDSTSPENIPGAFHIPKKEPLPISLPRTLTTVPQGFSFSPKKPSNPGPQGFSFSSKKRSASGPQEFSFLPTEPSKAGVVSKAMAMVAEYGTASLPPFGLDGVGETPAESSKAGTRSPKGKGRAEEPPSQDTADSLNWNVVGLDGTNAGPEDDSEEDGSEKANLILGFQAKSRQLATMVKTKAKQ